jgi:DNA-binding transcriptional regulator YdaS (Cro superfamily)
MADIDLNAVLARHGLAPADLYALGFSVRSVGHWRNGARRISVRGALLIADKLGIALHELRPDVWAPPPRPARTPRRREAAVSA